MSVSSFQDSFLNSRAFPVLPCRAFTSRAFGTALMNGTNFSASLNVKGRSVMDVTKPEVKVQIGKDGR